MTVDSKELHIALKENPNGVIEMNLPGAGKQSVMISEIQKDSLSKAILHIDFHQINMDEPVRTTLAIEIVGEAQGVKEGGVLQVLAHEAEIRCLPENIPAHLQVEVSKLNIGENVLFSEIELPEGVELLSPAENVVVTIGLPQKEEAAETEEEAPAAEGKDQAKAAEATE